jgi:membrane-bound lytic murein transglycosylase B
MRSRSGVALIAGAVLAAAAVGAGAPLQRAREAAVSFVASNLTLQTELPDAVRHGISDADEKGWLLRAARESASLLRALPQPPVFTALPFTIEAVVTTPARAAEPRSVLVQAYEAAAASAPTGCHLPVTLLAAIGQVESGSIGGRSLYGHRVVPAIYGPMLTGGMFAAIRDTDRGRLDGNAQWDRAVGPMQFIPGTWSRYGVDGDRDGIADPQNVFDATASAASYLCMGGRDLSRAADLRAAVLSYNASGSYLATVLRWMSYFQSNGLGTVSAVSFPVASGAGTAVPSTTSLADPPPATPPRLPAPLSGPAGTGSPTSSPGPSAPTPSPTTTTSAPTTPTSDPTTTTSDPTTTTSDPTTTTSDPPTTTSDPTTTTSDPTTTTSDPTTTTSDPTTTTSDPTTTTSDPTTTTTTTTSNPTTTSSDPATSTSSATGTTADPTATTTSGG